MISKKTLPLATVLLSLCAQCAFCRAAQPNVIFILADDLGYGDIGINGNTIVNTPNIDTLARQGVLLTQHYSASPLCAPARAALLTGRYNHRTGAVDVPSNRGLDRISLEERTIGDIFTDAGYVTGYIGKWHNGLHDMRHHPNNRGFQSFVGFLNGGMDYYKWVIDRNGHPEESDGRYLTDLFATEACHFITENQSHPFFLFVSFNAVHAPFQAPVDLIKKYREKGALNKKLSTLYAMTERMDQGIGTIMDTLDRHGLRKQSIVVFTSDNGAYLGGGVDRFNANLRGGKGSVYEGGIRVAAIANFPEQFPAGAVIEQVTHFCDWLPTLASLSSVALPDQHKLDGTDISSLLRGAKMELSKTRFWQRNRYQPQARCNAAMREGPWKLVWPMRKGADNKDPDDNISYNKGLTCAHWLMEVNGQLPSYDVAPPAAPQLFNLEDDPGETNDLAHAFPERVAAMCSAWDRWFANATREWHIIYQQNIKAQHKHP